MCLKVFYRVQSSSSFTIPTSVSSRTDRLAGRSGMLCVGGVGTYMVTLGPCRQRCGQLEASIQARCQNPKCERSFHSPAHSPIHLEPVSRW